MKNKLGFVIIALVFGFSLSITAANHFSTIFWDRRILVKIGTLGISSVFLAALIYRFFQMTIWLQFSNIFRKLWPKILFITMGVYLLIVLFVPMKYPNLQNTFEILIKGGKQTEGQSHRFSILEIQNVDGKVVPNSDIVSNNGWTQKQGVLVLQDGEDALLSYKFLGKPGQKIDVLFSADKQSEQVFLSINGHKTNIDISGSGNQGLDQIQKSIFIKPNISIEGHMKWMVLFYGADFVSSSLIMLIFLSIGSKIFKNKVAENIQNIPSTKIFIKGKECDQDPTRGINDKFLLGVLVIALCIGCFYILSLVINQFVQPEMDLSTINTIFIADIKDFHPEPNERILYFVTTLSILFICGASYMLLRKYFYNSSQPRLKTLFRIFGYISILALLGLMILGLNNIPEFSYLGSSSMIQKPFLTLIINIFLFGLVFYINQPDPTHFGIKHKLIKIIYSSFGFINISLIFLETIFNESDKWVPKIHFTAYFDSVAQVFLGKNLYVDTFSQYGSYALLLNPIFKIIGLDVLRFTIVMGMIKAIIYFCLLVLIWKISKNKIISLIGFAAIAFYTRMRYPIDFPTEPYFQYHPHRLLFPVLFILLAWFYISIKQSNKNTYIYYLISILCPISILWNPDTGLIVMGTWLIFLIFNEFLFFNQKQLKQIILNCINHLIGNIWVSIYIFSAFVVYIFLTSGEWPNIAGSAEYIKLFNYYGFFMLPMPPIHIWNIVILVYVIGLLVSISFMIDTSRSQEIDQGNEVDFKIPQLYFILSIIGIGLFYYYVGRSHTYNLIGPSWPSLLLCIIFADQLFTRISPILKIPINGFRQIDFKIILNDIKVYVFIGLFYFLGQSVPSVFISFPAYRDVIMSRFRDIREGLPPTLVSQANFILSTFKASQYSRFW